MKVGIEKEKAVFVYRRLNGGYYMKIHYSKSPIMSNIINWPKLYLKTKFYPKLAQPGYNEAVQLLITLDVVSIIGMSSVLLNRPIQVQKIKEDVKAAFNSIREDAMGNSTYPFPEYGEVKITQDFFPFINDLVEKRREDDRRDLLEVLNDIAYESKTMEEVRVRHPWAKTIRREQSLKAFGLAGKLDDFLKENESYVLILSGQRSGYLDKLLTELGITEGLKVLKGNQLADTGFLETLEGIKRKILEISNYI
ncbi:conserved hypothetical protein [Metallosphaera cuprina Ar-4]|uniref:Uncharacterized protein n=2 Tax=Sulfolobaceae TaxID=118883 RepID=F4FYN1_METCR|nr:conserved hypothetical protein [Metallosphaera cuprina Ar-4]